MRVLQRVRAGATLADATARERESLADSRDRALAHDLAAGTLRWRAALDRAIAAASSRPLDRLDDDVLDILRLGAYQLRHLDRTPPHAVVDDAAELTRLVKLTSAVGFVNGVLRSLARAGPDAGLPARPADPLRDRDAALDFLAIAGSHPRWLVDRWLAREGFAATERWVAFDNSPAPLCLRASLRKTTPAALEARLREEGVDTVRGAWMPDALIVQHGNPLTTATAHEGWFLVQDEASQIVGMLAAAWEGRRRLDTCAAPGGKTVALAEGFGGGARTLTVAGDRRPRRMRLLRETLARAGHADVPLVQLDVARALPFGPVFDLVLVDAPCSGLGTIRREPDLKWRRAPEDLARMAEVQQRMLAVAARVVAPGGTLVYATCSSEPDENDAVADRFLNDHPAFEPAGRPPWPSPPPFATLLDEAGRLRTSPVRDGLEAFYSAAFRRRR